MNLLVREDARTEVSSFLVHILDDGPSIQIEIVDLAFCCILLASEQIASEYEYSVFMENDRVIGPTQEHGFFYCQLHGSEIQQKDS